MPSRKDIDANNLKIVNVATPISDTDAATKKYVDDSVAGGAQQFLPYSTGWLNLSANSSLDILVGNVSANRQLCCWGYMYLVGNNSSDQSVGRTHAIYHVLGDYYVYIDSPKTIYGYLFYSMAGSGNYLSPTYYIDGDNCYVRITNYYTDMIYKVRLDYNRMYTNFLL